MSAAADSAAKRGPRAAPTSRRPGLGGAAVEVEVEDAGVAAAYLRRRLDLRHELANPSDGADGERGPGGSPLRWKNRMLTATHAAVAGTARLMYEAASWRPYSGPSRPAPATPQVATDCESRGSRPETPTTTNPHVASPSCSPSAPRSSPPRPEARPGTRTPAGPPAGSSRGPPGAAAAAGRSASAWAAARPAAHRGPAGRRTSLRCGPVDAVSCRKASTSARPSGPARPARRARPGPHPPPGRW